MPEVEVASLSLDDRADNVSLARDVGWPDTEGDWNVIHAGAHVVGVRVGGRLVGQGALGLYGRVGTTTPLGRPLYHRAGFLPAGDVARGRPCFGRAFAKPPRAQR